MRALRWPIVALGVWAALAIARLATTPPPRVDWGALRVVVLQSDDWGLEGWYPDRAAADSLADTATGLAERLRAYATSSLETAAEVESLAALLSGFRDADGLPAVLQANTIVAAAAAGDTSLALHDSGSGDGPYARPGLQGAIDAAIAAGVWWPELHGLTHFDLAAYREALRQRDPLAQRAAGRGAIAYRHWRAGTELASPEPGHALRIAADAVSRFQRRFGRPPASVIAPDYVWGDADEAAWRQLGLKAVQAKEEQVDPRHTPVSVWGRARKVVDRWWDERRAGLRYLRRPAELEPYGVRDPNGPQCCSEALAQVRAAWSSRRPGIVGVHRVQLSNLDPEIAAAGRAQLRCLLEHLIQVDGARFLVDDELVQLEVTGRSRVVRGGTAVERGLDGGQMTVDTEPGPPSPGPR